MDRQRNKIFPKAGSNVVSTLSGAVSSWISSCSGSLRPLSSCDRCTRAFTATLQQISAISQILQIHSITGFHRDSIKSAREQLTKLKEITPLGYHTFKVRAFTKLQESCPETGQLIIYQIDIQIYRRENLLLIILLRTKGRLARGIKSWRSFVRY